MANLRLLEFDDYDVELMLNRNKFDLVWDSSLSQNYKIRLVDRLKVVLSKRVANIEAFIEKEVDKEVAAEEIQLQEVVVQPTDK